MTGGLGGEFVPRVWESASGKPVVALEATAGTVDSISFSPDASLVAAADDEGNSLVWDAATGTRLRAIEGPTEAVLVSHDVTPSRTVLFSPDGRRLLTGGPGHALLWNLELDRRSPAEVGAVVAGRSPWRLDDGRLVRRAR